MDETSLGGFVVIGGNDEKAVCAGSAGFLAKRDGVNGIIAARASNDGHFSAYVLDSEFDGIDLLLVGEGGGFACGSANDERVNACGKLSIDDACKSFVVNSATLHGGDEGGSGAFEERCFHNVILSCPWGHKHNLCISNL
jgi:hypothetical protein